VPEEAPEWLVDELGGFLAAASKPPAPGLVARAMPGWIARHLPGV